MLALEQILFGAELSDKLTPVRILFEGEGKSTPPLESIPQFPGRPFALRERGKKGPSWQKLLADEGPQAHGLLLHHFANHELQAIELLALALLSFPSAPEAYRRELLQLLADEQRHLQLYLERMKELGVELGDLPLSFHFWKTLRQVPDWKSFLCGMNLTFEQANLDFGLTYWREFFRRGDGQTANILRTVLYDEIAHVGHGVRWMKNSLEQEANGATLWDAYCRHLPATLSPIRGKGTTFSRALRRRAGLPDDFTENMRLFADSRGRRPNLYYFNPPASGKVGRRLRHDLGLLVSFLAADDDVVLLDQKPSETYLLAARNAGFYRARVATPQTVERIPGRLICFETNERALKLAADLESNFQQRQLDLTGSMISTWPLIDKLPRHRLLQMATNSAPDVFPPDQIFYRLCTDAMPDLEYIQASYKGSLVCKPPRSAAGQGFFFVEPGSMPTHFRKERYSVAESWVDKLIDVSLLFFITAEGVRFSGYTQFLTEKGRYLGTFCSRLATTGPMTQRLLDHMRTVARSTGVELQRQGYRGPVGIDGYLFRVQGEVHCQPCSEINLRYTFGHIALRLRALLDPGQIGLFWLLKRKEALALYLRTGRLAPGRLPAAGLYFLGDPESAQALVPVFVIAGSPAEALATVGGAAALKPPRRL